MESAVKERVTEFVTRSAYPRALALRISSLRPDRLAGVGDARRQLAASCRDTLVAKSARFLRQRVVASRDDTRGTRNGHSDPLI